MRGLAPNQFEFRPGIGTVEAIQVLGVAENAPAGLVRDKHLCVLVTLDICNAFNLAPWSHIDAGVSEFRLPTYVRRLIRSYLSRKRIMVPGESGYSERQMTCSDPQESVLGLTLWNIFYNNLLKLQLPVRVVLVEFADDVGLLTTNRTTEEIEATTNLALRMVDT